MSKIVLGTTADGDLVLPEEAITQGFGIIARRRSGKSNLAGVMEETFCERGDPWVALDPVGAHWGIRYLDAKGQPGKPSGYDVMIVGGKYSDVPLEEKHGAALAQIIVETDISCVIDMSAESMAAQQKFTADFANELLKLNETPRHVIIEEAQEFVPQQLIWDNQKYVRGALTKMVKGGGGKGIGYTLISQRPASVAKDVLEQIDNLFVLRMSGPNDLKAVQAWFEHNVGDKAQMAHILSTLPAFKPGEAWLLSPDWMHEVARMQVRERRTYHAGRTPKRGEAMVKPKRVELGEVIGKYRDAASKRQIAITEERDLKAEVATLRREQTAAAKKALRIETKPCNHEPEIARLNGEVENWHKMALIGLAATEEYQRWLKTAPEPAQAEIPARQWKSAPMVRTASVRVAVSKPSTNGHRPIADLEGITRGSGAYRMLQRLAERYPETWTRAQLATLAKIKKSGGTFGTYYSRLNQRGLIVEEGGRVSITDEGLALMGGPPDSPQSHDELLESWRERLTGGARRMFDELLSAGERGLTREQLSERADIAQTGGTFGTYLSRLMTNGLVEKRGDLIAATDLLLGVA